jgi:hypothetical protein
MSIAIITGASSGMGAEFARQIPYFYSCIDEIWLLARRTDRLEKTAERIKTAGLCHNVKCIEIDICDIKQLEDFSQKLSQTKPRVRFLVNCAGRGRVGDFADMDGSESDDMIELNCLALTRITRMVIPYMIKKSHIINLASAAAFIPEPGFNVYSASKAFVHRFSRALDVELKKKNISVTSVCPGPVRTEFFDIADPDGELKIIKKLFMADPVKVVTKAINDAALNKKVSIYGFTFKILYFAVKIIPECIIMRFIY